MPQAAVPIQKIVLAKSDAERLAELKRGGCGAPGGLHHLAERLSAGLGPKPLLEPDPVVLAERLYAEMAAIYHDDVNCLRQRDDRLSLRS